MDVDTFWDIKTQKLHDAAYTYEAVECDNCERLVRDDEDAYESIVDDKLIFCSQGCVEEWEEENKHVGVKR